MTNSLYTVYEATNEALNERYVGYTRKPMFQAIADLQARPPAEIAHWDFKDVHNYKSVEFELPLSTAVRIVSEYCKKSRVPGWKCICQPASEWELA